MKALLRCWFCDVTALARSWTSSDGWFQGKSPDRLPGRELLEQEESSGAQERESENADAPRLLNCPVLDTTHRRLVESECLYGVEPCPCPWDIPSLHFHVTKNKLLPMY